MGAGVKAIGQFCSFPSHINKQLHQEWTARSWTGIHMGWQHHSKQLHCELFKVPLQAGELPVLRSLWMFPQTTPAGDKSSNTRQPLGATSISGILYVPAAALQGFSLAKFPSNLIFQSNIACLPALGRFPNARIQDAPSPRDFTCL